MTGTIYLLMLIPFHVSRTCQTCIGLILSMIVLINVCFVTKIHKLCLAPVNLILMLILMLNTNATCTHSYCVHNCVSLFAGVIFINTLVKLCSSCIIMAVRYETTQRLAGAICTIRTLLVMHRVIH